jgi:hypothetical protein
MNPIGYKTVDPTKKLYDLASVTMAFNFMKLASSTSFWLSFKTNYSFVMAVACSVRPIEVLMVHGHFSKVSFVSPKS